MMCKGVEGKTRPRETTETERDDERSITHEEGKWKGKKEIGRETS